MTRKDLEADVWRLVDPSIDGYSALIASLLNLLTYKQLRKLVSEWRRSR